MQGLRAMQPGRDGAVRWQRYEAKFLINECQAAEIRRYCLDHLPRDSHASRRNGYEYPVNSLYLDSASRVLLQHTLQKRMNRYKLRVRTYRQCHEAWTDAPVFVEIKRRLNGLVHKTRARVGPEAVESLIWADCTLFDGRGAYDRATEENVNAFLRLRNQIRAFPVVGTWYMREAYEGNSAERIRITLDRGIHYGIWMRAQSEATETWAPVNAGGVVLEVKFTNTYPFWVAHMLRRLDVLRRGVCKYVLCAQAAGVWLRSRSVQESFVTPGRLGPVCGHPAAGLASAESSLPTCAPRARRGCPDQAAEGLT